jgi:hypothetical protein
VRDDVASFAFVPSHSCLRIRAFAFVMDAAAAWETGAATGVNG